MKGGGALSPKFAPNRGFPLKLPANCIVLKKILGERGLGLQGSPDPLVTQRMRKALDGSLL